MLNLDTHRVTSDPTDDRRSSTTLLPESSLNSVSMKQRPSPQRLRVLEEGRDGGGSRSGAPSQCGSDTSDDSRQPSHKSMAMALHGTLEGKSPQRARADALGDQSDVDDDVAP